MSKLDMRLYQSLPETKTNVADNVYDCVFSVAMINDEENRNK